MVHARGRGLDRRGGRLRDRILRPRPVEPTRAGHVPAVRGNAGIRSRGGECVDLLGAVGAHGDDLARARRGRTSRATGGSERDSLVRRHDTSRLRRHPVCVRSRCFRGRRRIVRRDPERRALVLGRPRVGDLRVGGGRIRCEGRGGTAACVVAARASGGAESRVGADVGGDGHARYLRGRARRRRPTGRRSALVGSAGAGARGSFGPVRDLARARRARRQGLARLLDHRECRADARGRRYRDAAHRGTRTGVGGRRARGGAPLRLQSRTVQGPAFPGGRFRGPRDRDRAISINSAV